MRLRDRELDADELAAALLAQAVSELSRAGREEMIEGVAAYVRLRLRELLDD